MKKLLSIPLLAISFSGLMISCKKPDDKIDSPYYFNYKFDGATYNFSSKMDNNLFVGMDGVVGEFISEDKKQRQVGLYLSWDDAVSDSIVMGLAGKYIGFNSTNPSLSMTFMEARSVNYMPSTGINISSVTYVRTDTVIDPVDIYELKGSCAAAYFQQDYKLKKLTDGSFCMLVGHGHKE